MTSSSAWFQTLSVISEDASLCRSGSDDTGETSTVSSPLDTPKQFSHRRREEDRHNYDDEEKFAILYLRIERGEKWSDVQRHIHMLFPPDAPRRQAGKGLTRFYVRRRKGGLECRYYRLREDLNLKALRSSEYTPEHDRAALAKLQETLQLSEVFSRLLRTL